MASGNVNSIERNVRNVFWKCLGKSFMIVGLASQIFTCPSVYCKRTFQLPHEELDNIIITLLDDYDSVRQNLISDPKNTSSLVVDYIRNEVKYLVNQLDLLSQISSKGDDTLLVLKAGYQGELTVFVRTIENLKRSTDEDVSAIAGYMEKVMTESQKRTSLASLKGAKKRILDRCLSKINSEEFSSAILEFKKLGIGSLPDIIERAYDHNVDNIRKVLKFITHFECKQQSFATELLLRQVKTDGYLKRPEVLYFFGVNDKCENGTLINELAGFESEIIESTLYSDKSELLPCVLKSDKHFHGGDTSSKVIIYSLIFDLMEKDEDLFRIKLVQLAYKVRELDRYCKSNPFECQQIKPKLKSLIGRFPSGVRALLWDKFVYFESKRHPGYRLTANGSDVYLYPSGSSSTQQWVATALEGGRYFQFQTLSDMVMHAIGDKSPRWLHVDRYTGEGRLWQVIPFKDNRWFYLKNKVLSDAVDSAGLGNCPSSNSSKCSRAFVHPMMIGHPYHLWSLTGQSS